MNRASIQPANRSHGFLRTRFLLRLSEARANREPGGETLDACSAARYVDLVRPGPASASRYASGAPLSRPPGQAGFRPFSGRTRGFPGRETALRAAFSGSSTSRNSASSRRRRSTGSRGQLPGRYHRSFMIPGSGRAFRDVHLVPPAVPVRLAIGEVSRMAAIRPLFAEWLSVELCHAAGNFGLELPHELQFGAVASIIM